MQGGATLSCKTVARLIRRPTRHRRRRHGNDLSQRQYGASDVHPPFPLQRELLDTKTVSFAAGALCAVGVLAIHASDTTANESASREASLLQV